MLLVLLDMAWGFLLRVAPVSASTPVRGVREDMLKFRSGVTLGCAVRSGAPVTWVPGPTEVVGVTKRKELPMYRNIKELVR